ncbi:hypothetical protein ACIBI9_17935 [Nonomuraea sp. NPDC050451]|uniref:hypothetical protein n=1 Tax=Nonomuraea sp. NPDC050451 TaxID=3364364 RepID=UPI0037AD7A42
MMNMPEKDPKGDDTSEARPPEKDSYAVDARYARGVQINSGPGGNSMVNNFFEQPSLDEDLRTLRLRDLEGAFRKFIECGRDRQVDLLSEYERAGEIANLICARKGPAQCAELLYGMAAERFMKRLGELTRDHRSAVMTQLAERLSKDGSGAAVRLREYAAANPGRAAQLLIGITRVDSSSARFRTHRAAQLLPGVEYVLGLKDEMAAALLRALLFRYAVDSASGERYPLPELTRDAPGLLERLVISDVHRTARLMAALGSAKLVAACIRRLRLASATRLLDGLAVVSQTGFEAVLRALPQPMAAVLLGRVSDSNAASVSGRPWTSGWPWIDAVLALMTYANAIADRLVSRAGLDASEIRNIQDIWRAACRTVKNSDYYRRQRNHLAGAAVVLFVGLVLALLLG